MDKPTGDFKARFNKAISKQNIKPIELSEKTGISKSAISHYMSGYTKPKSDKLYALSKALNVSEAWLMGYDVPMERSSDLNFSVSSSYDASNWLKHTSNEQELLFKVEFKRRRRGYKTCEGINLRSRLYRKSRGMANTDSRNT